MDNKGPSSFAYFFEQDYNLILVKTSKLLRVVQKRFDAALIRFYLKRTSTRLYLRNILPQDFADKAEERILIQALKVELAVRDKREKKIVKKENLSKKSKPAFNYKKHEKEEYAICLNESSSEEPAE